MNQLYVCHGPRAPSPEISASTSIVVLEVSTIVPVMSTTSRSARQPREPGAVLFGQTRRGVLGWLLGHADEAFYLSQIVRQTGAARGAVQRELNALTSAGGSIGGVG